LTPASLATRAQSRPVGPPADALERKTDLSPTHPKKSRRGDRRGKKIQRKGKKRWIEIHRKSPCGDKQK
jgi:hypothetical protein